jgi:HPt (histidine-containing phosphotransfer) domain-containing protein
VGKSKRSDKEYTREQRLVQENRLLKRQVSSLRKELARVDLDRFKNLKETIEQHYQDDKRQEGQDIIEHLKQEWRCTATPGCQGYLEITLFNKINDTWYYRRCTDCPHRTRSQKYSPEVKGIIKNSK